MTKLSLNIIRTDVENYYEDDKRDIQYITLFC